MNDAVDLWVLGKHTVEAGLVCDVDLVEGGSLATDKLDAVYGGLGRVEETIDNDDIVAVLEEGEGGEGADVASTTAKRDPESISHAATTIIRVRATRQHRRRDEGYLAGCNCERRASRRSLRHSRRSTQLPVRRNWSAVHLQG